MMDLPPEVPTSQERIIEQRLIDCGLAATGLSVKYEEDLQSIEVIIRPAAQANQAHFACIQHAVEHEIVTFEDGAMDSAYSEYSAQAYRPKMIESLAATLQERHLLRGLPQRRDFPSLAEYASALEKHAGLKSGEALRVFAESIVFDPPKKAALPADFAAQYSDLLSVVMFAAERDHINFGFIGNMAVAPDR